MGCELCGEDLSEYNTVDARGALGDGSLPSLLCFRCLVSCPAYWRNEAVLVSTPIALNIARLASHALSVWDVYESVECGRRCGRRMLSHPCLESDAPRCFVCGCRLECGREFRARGRLVRSSDVRGGDGDMRSRGCTEGAGGLVTRGLFTRRDVRLLGFFGRVHGRGDPGSGALRPVTYRRMLTPLLTCCDVLDGRSSGRCCERPRSVVRRASG